MRRLPVGRVPASFEGAGCAAAYAETWLAMSGAEIARGGPPIRLWDFQVGMEGSDADASAVAGPAAAIGHGNGPGVPLPANMPEKWCGLVGAILALAEAWCGTDGGGPEYDASTADIMRAFALQNSGTPEERRRLWKRNGRICVEHGLIFPMGFFACRDGHVALLGRSRRDWRRIAAALGDPEWARRPGFDNPFALARDSAEPDALLEETLADKTRDDLLARGLEEGAVVAPVYSYDEAQARGVFRPGFEKPAMPFLAEPLGNGAAVGRQKRGGPAGPLEGLAALVARDRDGRGRALDLSQIEAAAALAATPAVGPPQPMTVPVVELDDSDASPVFAGCPGWIEAHHPVTGPERLVAAPWRVDGKRPPFRKPAPMLDRGAER